jgi:Tfp pilus assembly protein PilW
MNSKGVSLLENLIAVIILVLIIFGMMGIFISGRQNITHSRSLVAAAELGRYYLDPLQMQVRQDLWAGNCLGAGNGALCDADNSTFPDQDINGIIYTPNYVVSDAPGPGGTTVPTVHRVKLTVTWTEPDVE